MCNCHSDRGTWACECECVYVALPETATQTPKSCWIRANLFAMKTSSASVVGTNMWKRDMILFRHKFMSSNEREKKQVNLTFMCCTATHMLHAPCSEGTRVSCSNPYSLIVNDENPPAVACSHARAAGTAKKKLNWIFMALIFCFYNRPQSPLDHCWQRDDCTSKYNWACVALSHAPLCPVDSINRHCNGSVRAVRNVSAFNISEWYATWMAAPHGGSREGSGGICWRPVLKLSRHNHIYTWCRRYTIWTP